MDDVALAIRRARRSNAKRLDLSNRSLRTWPEDLFSLQQLEALDISGNWLETMDRQLALLENLEELDLSGNRLGSVSDVSEAVANLTKLRSLKLDGNPVTAQLPTGAARQMVRPAPLPGQTPAQAICGILLQGSSAPPPLPVGGGLGSLGGACGLGGLGGQGAPPPGGDTVTPFRPDIGAAPDIGRILGGGDSPSTWRQEQASLTSEVEKLRARVRELEDRGSTADSSPGSGSPLPSWLQKSGKVTSLSATLPSRRSDQENEDEATRLRGQLAEEERKCKRLQQEVQRLTDRAAERAISSGAIGSAPHFEFNSDVELGDLLSQGGFSVVHKGAWHGTKVAIKKLFDPNITKELLDEFDNEVQKLEQIRHPHILLLLAVHRKPPALSMITELVEGGSLYQFLHYPAQFNSATGPLSGPPGLPELLDIMEVAAGALAFLHARGMVHRDIKSHNVLLSPHLVVKLCDFGLARMRSELNTGAMQFAGTPSYMAPEIFRNQKYSETVDTWAFGTTLWEIAERDIPWANFDAADIRERVVAGRMMTIPSSIPGELQALIQDCWILDKSERPGMAAVFAALKVCPREGSGSRSRRPNTANPAGRFAGSSMAGSRPPIGDN